MTCEKVTNYENNYQRDCILETLKQIERMQKEAYKETDCVTCTGPLIKKVYDTKPVTITLKCGTKFTAYLGLTNCETDLFRVEEVKNNCVLLRLLKLEGPQVNCTNYTALVDVDCICALQCFPPVKCHIDKHDVC